MIKKCIILAAGIGTRLLPITNHVPKCLVEINGRPLLEYWLILLQKHGITDVLINTHHLSEQVINYIDSQNTPLAITLSFEKKLLGSLGTVVKNREFYKNEESILVVNGDNLTNLDITKYIKCHFSHNFDASIALKITSKPSECGIIEINSDKKIISFEEKPKHPKTNISNAGVYIFDTSIFNNLEVQDCECDIGYDLIPRLIGQSYGYLLDDVLIDIGSHSSLNEARKLSELFFQSNFGIGK